MLHARWRRAETFEEMIPGRGVEGRALPPSCVTEAHRCLAACLAGLLSEMGAVIFSSWVLAT